MPVTGFIIVRPRQLNTNPYQQVIAPRYTIKTEIRTFPNGLRNAKLSAPLLRCHRGVGKGSEAVSTDERQPEQING